jgi:hypothetical protein
VACNQARQSVGCGAKDVTQSSTEAEQSTSVVAGPVSPACIAKACFVE